MAKKDFDPQVVLRRSNVNVSGNLASGRTLVFVHGFGTDQTAWDSVCPAFADGWRIVRLDNAGAGGTAPDGFEQGRYLKLDRYADELLDVAAALELQDAVLVGHSVGGMIGILSAIRAPEWFSRLVLIGASPRYLNDDGYAGGLSNHDVRDVHDAIRLNHEEWVTDYSRLAMQNPERPELSRSFAKTLQRIPKERVLTVLHSILQTDYRAELPKLEVPTLIIQSQSDPFVPMAVAEYLQRNIRGSRLELIDAHGHLPHISAPETVITAMRRFLEN